MNAKTKSGLTPLMDAAINGNLTTMKLLIAAGADVHAQNVFGRTARDWALRARRDGAYVHPAARRAEMAKLLEEAAGKAGPSTAP